MIFNAIKKQKLSFSLVSVEQPNIKLCLSADTLILLSNGEQRQMIDITNDCSIMSKNGTPTEIIKFERGMFNSYHTLYYFDNNITIDETYEHRFFNYNQKCWAKLKDWNLGDYAIDFNGEKHKLLGKERINEKAEMFAMWTASHDYYANGLLSGDARANLSLIGDGDLNTCVRVLASVDPKQWFSIAG